MCSPPDPIPPTRTWRLLAPVLPVLALLYAHARGLPRAWSGDMYFGCPLQTDRCDVLYTLRLARATLTHLQDAWQQVDGPLQALLFLLRDLWRVAFEARVANMADLLLLVLPLRTHLPIGPTLALLHMGLLILACLGGYAFARSLGASRAAGMATGLVAAASGVVVTSTAMGQYPQALLPLALGTFAGLARLWRGQRGGVPLTAVMAALSVLFYWQNALILGVGAFLWGLGAWLAGLKRSPRLPLHLLLALGLCALLILPAAVPLFETMQQGSDWKLQMTPWGSPYLLPLQQGWTPASPSALSILDAISPAELLSPSGGWLLPALPIMVAALLAATRRRHLPWVLLVLLAALLVLGPLPVVPSWAGGSVLQAYGDAPRLLNPVYTAFFRWVPTAARMHHALRWGTLLASGLCALTALGTDMLLRRSRTLALGLLAAGAAWAIWVGPWPIPLRPFPGQAEEQLAACQEVIVAPIQPTATVFRTPGEAHLLEGVVWQGFYPLYHDPLQGWPDPTAEEWAVSTDREAALDQFLAGGDAHLPTGACVLVDVEATRIPMGSVQQRFATLGLQPSTLTLPAGTFHKQTTPRALQIYRLP